MSSSFHSEAASVDAQKIACRRQQKERLKHESPVLCRRAYVFKRVT